MTQTAAAWPGQQRATMKALYELMQNHVNAVTLLEPPVSKRKAKMTTKLRMVVKPGAAPPTFYLQYKTSNFYSRQLCQQDRCDQQRSHNSYEMNVEVKINVTGAAVKGEERTTYLITNVDVDLGTFEEDSDDVCVAAHCLQMNTDVKHCILQVNDSRVL